MANTFFSVTKDADITNENNSKWKLLDIKSSKNSASKGVMNLDDMLTTLSFNADGSHLAIGDQGGRVTVFQYKEGNRRRSGPYKSIFCVGSHTPFFDKLRSVVVSPKILFVKWFNHSNQNRLFLSSNVSTLKVWKIKNKVKAKKNSKNPFSNLPLESVDDISFTIDENKHEQYHSKLVHEYVPNLRTPYNGLSISYDDQIILASDSISIGMFHSEIVAKKYEILTFEESVEDITEIISTLTFFNKSSSLYIYGTNIGKMHVCDLRVKSKCDTPVQSIYNLGTNEELHKTCFSEIQSIKNVGDYIISRDFLNVTLWDLRKAIKPIRIFNVNEPCRHKVWEMMRNDSIFHKFDVSCDSQMHHIVTGSYNNQFHLYELDENMKKFETEFTNLQNSTYHPTTITNTVTDDSCGVDHLCAVNNQEDNLVVEKSVFEAADILSSQRCSKNKKIRKIKSLSVEKAETFKPSNLNTINPFPTPLKPEQFNVLKPNLEGKISHVDWHPSKNLFTIASQYDLYFYEGVNAANRTILFDSEL